MNSKERESKFHEIVSGNRKIIYKVCHTYCRDRDDRKDLEQEIMIQIWKSCEKFKDNYKLSTWIYRISLNTAISHYRKEKSKQKLSEEYTNEIIFRSEDTHEQEKITEYSEDNSEKAEKINFIYEYMEDLDKLNKALLLLYLEGNTYKEISEILGITETNTASKISRLKDRIKKQFNKQK